MSETGRREFLESSTRMTLGLAAGAGLPRSSTPAHAAVGEAAAQSPLKVCMVSGSVEYRSDESLGEYQKYLEGRCAITCSRAFRKTDEDLPGLEALETCDALLLFTRRLQIAGEQLERVKRYCLAGRPIVGVRTASHAFQNWLALDKEVLGGNYHGHYDAGPLTQVQIVEAAKSHPVLKGVEPFESV